jgi:hypothetical protein
MFGLLFAKRADAEHWWDADELVRARNEDFERELEALVDSYGVPHPRRQRDEDESVNQWIKLAIYAGVPAVIAMYLVFQLSARHDQKLDVTMQMMERHMHTTQAISERVERADRTQWLIVNLLRAQCVNTAKNQSERGECLRAGSQ